MSHRYEIPNLSVAKWLQCRQQSDVLAVLLVTNPTKNWHGARRRETGSSTFSRTGIASG